jgi:phosphate transport system substrate-binding protein
MRLLSAVFALASLSAIQCVHAQEGSLRVGGSTTALPIISACSAHFMEKYPSWDKADPALGKEQPVIYVTGGGSGFGVKGLMNGTIDVGMVSRDLKDSEIKALKQPLTQVFARDAVAIASHAASPLAKVKQDLTSAELAAIFSGQMEQFSQVDSRLPAKTMVLLTRDASGGVTEIFQERIMKQQRLAASRLQFPSTAALIKKLESNEATIGFVSAGAVSQDAQVKTYTVDGVAPTQENIINGRYSLNRPMLLIAKAEPGRKVQLFMDFVQGECQSTVKEMGFVPVRAGK